jgi:AcrR family transcriptional regulator
VTPRQREIIAAARALLEREGPDALSMRAVAAAVGMRAPSLYVHFPDKAALIAALVTEGLQEQADAMADAATLGELVAAYRGHAAAHPHLHRLMTRSPLPRDLLPEGLEARAAAPLMALMGGDIDRARAAWAFAEGMIGLEQDGRFPPGADLDAAWAAGVAALSR